MGIQGMNNIKRIFIAADCGSLDGKLARGAQATAASQAIGRLQCPK